MHLHFWLAGEFFLFIIFFHNGLTLPSKWASRIRFNGTDCSYWIIFLPFQRVCHLTGCLITLLNLYSRKTRHLGNSHFISIQELEREYFTIKFGYVELFKATVDFSQWGRNVKENAILLFKGWSLGSLLGKRIPGQMLSISQPIPGRVIERGRDTAEMYHKLGDNGRIYVFRSLGDMDVLPKRSFCIL